MILDIATRTAEAGITVFELSGRLTLGHELTGFETTVRKTIEQGCRRMVLDLEHLDFLDSSGVGTLVMCAGTMQRAGGEIRVAGANPRVTQVFEITNLGKVMPIVRDAAAACASFPGSAAAS